MNRDEAQARMQEVQRIMERTTLYTLLPRSSAIIGGVLTLAGCLVSYLMIGTANFQDALKLPINQQLVFCFMWLGIGIVAVVQHIILTRRAAEKRGLSPKARPFRFATYSLTPSVFVAAVLTLEFLWRGQMTYIAPVWMMCYGSGVYAAGLFSVRLPRLLGITFIVLGAVSLLFFPDFGIITAAVSFGLLHIIFGLIVINRSRENGEE
ncbi:MAG: hypothetical protein KGZ25_12305 [Planctomycetes bacterium]|nr:hypothetical protein [Planctomycetota bacterium]